MVRHVAAAVALSSLLLASGALSCASSSPSRPSSSQQAPPPPPSSGGGGPCGVRIFRAPACQQALDSVCCPFERECARDGLCLALNACVEECKTRLGGQAQDSCTNGCAIRSRDDYCRGACQGQGPDCQTICLQRGGPAEPMVKWALIADCSKSVRYPDGVRCDDDT